jgi:D-glycero-alpha-D-manno-heptose-7-phosphate kinase
MTTSGFFLLEERYSSVMIVTKTPLRVSFFGGGSDIPQYYQKKAGMVISTSIDKSIHIAVNKSQPSHIKAMYSEIEIVDDVEKLKHNRIKEALKRFKISSNIEIGSFSDVSTKGTGLGSSSTFTVGLLKALYNLKYMVHNKRDLAELACEIEIDKCGEPIGKQDQYAAAYGGFNVIRFDSTGVEVTPLNIGASALGFLNENLICYSTGINRNTSDILSDQIKNIEGDASAFDNTSKLVDLAEEALKHLRANRFDYFGTLLDEGWKYKKMLSSKISNPHIDQMYDTATRAGALGGKLLGAGGGGYMMFYVPERSRGSVALAMRDYRRFHFKFTDQGSVAVGI